MTPEERRNEALQVIKRSLAHIDRELTSIKNYLGSIVDLGLVDVQEETPSEIRKDFDQYFKNALAAEAKIKEDVIKSLGTFIQISETWDTALSNKLGFKGIGHENVNGKHVTQAVVGTFEPEV